jgi:hypothetical protein
VVCNRTYNGAAATTNYVVSGFGRETEFKWWCKCEVWWMRRFVVGGGGGVVAGATNAWGLNEIIGATRAIEGSAY